MSGGPLVPVVPDRRKAGVRESLYLTEEGTQEEEGGGSGESLQTVVFLTWWGGKLLLSAGSKVNMWSYILSDNNAGACYNVDSSPSSPRGRRAPQPNCCFSLEIRNLTSRVQGSWRCLGSVHFSKYPSVDLGQQGIPQCISSRPAAPTAALAKTTVFSGP